MIHKDTALEAIRSLIAELESIADNIEDENYNEAADEIEGQSGVLATLHEKTKDWQNSEHFHSKDDEFQPVKYHDDPEDLFTRYSSMESDHLVEREEPEPDHYYSDQDANEIERK